MSSPPPAKRLHIISSEDTFSPHHCNNTINQNNDIMAANGEDAVDENLYSRQLYVLGAEGMRRLAHNNILISGLAGLGLEVAKNIVLGGVKSVTLHDPDSITTAELSSNYYALPSDVGKNRCDICKPKLAELNGYVQLDILDAPELTTEHLKNFQVVVLTRGTSEDWRRVAKICRSLSVKVVFTKTCGLFGQIFCDFGSEFTVLDSTGDPPISVMIQSVEKNKEGIVFCLEDTRHGFEDGDFVTFSEVRGMTELNNCEPRKVKVVGPEAFSIGDTSDLSEYIGGGICTQVIVPELVHFTEFSQAFLSPEFIMSDFAKCETPAQLHIIFEALSKFQLAHGRTPAAWNEKDSELFLACALELNKSLKGSPCHVEELDESLTKIFSYICAGNCCPIQSVIGGTVAQEVMKACTGRFVPIKQWFYFDAIECLPAPWCKKDASSVLPQSELKAYSARYEGQCAIFGNSFQEKLGNLNYFIVGAGAIGCEHLKNFAMMGISCKDGKLYITDMDTIEKSNLNRQFLFRPWDIQKCKSTVAAVAAKRINPDINVISHENRVGPETEAAYDDNFFESLDGVANALDNVEARTYIDRRCVYYRKSLLESGTLGTKCSVQVVIPHLTESYSSSQDPPEKSIPMCTLKNFPYQIEHTLQWARDTFEGLFPQQSQSVDAYLRNPSEFFAKLAAGIGNQASETLETLKSNILTSRPKNFDDCIVWARNLWQELYSNSIRQLLFNFPADHKTTTGAPFWSGTKRCPIPLEFDVNDSTHLEFIIAAANLRAFIFSLPGSRDVAQIASRAAVVEAPKFEPRSGITIDVNDSEMQARTNASSRGSSDSALEDLKKSLPKPADLVDMKINVVDFEKDDDSNFHMDFITAASNLRAANYGIAPADRLKSKLIAGKIMPAIATTTSLVSGLVCLELYKLAQGHKSLDLYKNAFVNLSTPFFGTCEPMHPESWKYYDNSFTIWDRFEVPGGMTLQEFLDYFKNKHKLEITMLSQDVSMLYSFFMAQNKRNERLKMNMPQLVETVSKKRIAPHVRALVFELCATDTDGEDVEVPYVRYVLNNNAGSNH